MVLVNNSDRPLLLLAGEIVTGGKQDRVIGADRLVPPKSDPIDLSVFCVEPGRWVAHSDQFGSMKSQMAQPSVRVPAMAAKNQQQVWDQVASGAGKSAAMASSVEVTTRHRIAQATAAMTCRTLRSHHARMRPPWRSRRCRRRSTALPATTTASCSSCARPERREWWLPINGELVWVDLFASNDLLLRYWQKLVRSYAAESLTTVGTQKHVNEKDAEAFLDRMSGNREVIETDPGVFRRAEITGDNYKVFTLTELMPKTEFNVHTAKMLYDKEARLDFPRYDVVR